MAIRLVMVTPFSQGRPSGPVRVVEAPVRSVAKSLMDVTPECLGIEPCSSVITTCPFASAFAFGLSFPVVLIVVLTLIRLVPLVCPSLICSGTFVGAFRVSLPFGGSFAPFAFQEKRCIRWSIRCFIIGSFFSVLRNFHVLELKSYFVVVAFAMCRLIFGTFAFAMQDCFFAEKFRFYRKDIIISRFTVKDTILAFLELRS